MKDHCCLIARRLPGDGSTERTGAFLTAILSANFRRENSVPDAKSVPVGVPLVVEEAKISCMVGYFRSFEEQKQSAEAARMAAELVFLVGCGSFLSILQTASEVGHADVVRAPSIDEHDAASVQRAQPGATPGERFCKTRRLRPPLENSRESRRYLVIRERVAVFAAFDVVEVPVASSRSKRPTTQGAGSTEKTIPHLPSDWSCLGGSDLCAFSRFKDVGELSRSKRARSVRPSHASQVALPAGSRILMMYLMPRLGSGSV
jgi:hypothetical protein